MAAITSGSVAIAPFTSVLKNISQAVERRRVLRLGHRHRHALVFLVLRDRHDLVRGRHALIDQLGQLGRDRDVGQLDHLHAKLLAQGLHHLVFLDQIHPNRHLAEQLRARALLLLEHLPQGFLVEVTHVDHDRAESSRHVNSPEARDRKPKQPAAVGRRSQQVVIVDVEIENRVWSNRWKGRVTLGHTNHPGADPSPIREFTAY